MTQLPLDDFETSLEKAEAWMKEIHERLKENDNTQGPRSALESRLRETESICSLEGDGKLLVDKALMKAEILLSESGEEETHEIHLKLAKLKGLFEETTTYMIHCHSRIEWVWLHWNEYLRARDEFTLWIHNITLTLEPDVELQLGLKEKRWQCEQALVLLKDVLNHSCLVDRLLEEAASLYNRIGDLSVDESVQSAMMAEYIQIKKKAQERVEHLEGIWKDHEAYEGDVSGFKSWLNGVIEKLKFYVGAASNSTENRLSMLQDIGKDVESGDKQLEILEVKSVAVIKNTSPMGADKICKELEELRKTLKELKQMNDEEEETLLKTHNSENAFLLLAQQLEANIKEFCKATQRLEESLESGERVRSEDDLIALWRTLNATKSALAAEEAKAERVKVQLRDLFKFSKDVQPLSDGVISAMRDYQRAKSKAFKLSTDTESELRQLFQNPLREFLYWKPIAESVLDATAVPVNDGAMNHDALDNIEKLLEESCAIKDKLAALEKKKERIHLVLGEEKTKALLRDIAAAESEREALHQDLLQRRNWLQSLAEQGENLDSAIKTLHRKISAIRVKSIKENEPQPDTNGKEAQFQRLKILLEELTSLNSPIQELISITKSHSAHAPRAEQLNSDYLTLQRSLENMVRKSKENINSHRIFCHNLQDLQRWVIVTCQKLESYQNDGKHWSQREIEMLKAELSEKEIQLHLVEGHGQRVIDMSSPEGAAVIQTELKQLIDSWKSLQQLCKIMDRVVSDMDTDDFQQRDKTPTSKKTSTRLVSDMHTDEFQQRDKTPTSKKTSTRVISDMDTDDFQQRDKTPTSKKTSTRLVSDMDTDDFQQRDKTPTSKKTSTSHSQDGRVFHIHLPDDTNNAARNRGFGQIGGLSGSGYNVTTTSITDLPDGHPGYNNPSEVSGPKENSHSSNYDTHTINTNEKVDGDPTLGTQDRSDSVRLSGSADSSSSPRSAKKSKKRNAVKKVDGAFSTDPSSYQFRVIDQRDGSQEDEESERPGSADSHLFRSAGNTDGSKKNISSGRGFGLVRLRSDDKEVNELGDSDTCEAEGHELNGGSAKTSLQEDEELHCGAEFKINPGKLQITSGFVTEENINKKGKSPNNPRRNRKFVSLAESVDIVDSASTQRTEGNKEGDDHMKLLLEFEQWLQGESSTLNGICASPVSGSDGIKTQQSRLQNLRLRVPQGQKLFECLLRRRSSMTVTEDLKMEELRYLWMLYKSKLRDSWKYTNLKTTEEPRGVTKTSGGICSFLQRVCCAALPLQLLLLLLLLMAFLLPLLHDTKNCALSNNFARSFNLMLKYDGPPPT